LFISEDLPLGINPLFISMNVMNNSSDLLTESFVNGVLNKSLNPSAMMPRGIVTSLEVIREA
jgi:hypothetical protein